MRYYTLEPEVAGGLGRNTVMDRSVHPPMVERLHYELAGWLGDDLLETFPCFIVTNCLRERIADAGLTGTEFAPAEVTASQQFRDLYPTRDVPGFVWLKPTGRAGRDDFGMSHDHRLVVSARALKVLSLLHCRVFDFSGSLKRD
jgi:hypothetical protein